MIKIYQNTLKKPFTFEGKGLHTGRYAKIKIFPGKENKGIIFKRVDLHEKNLIKACYKNVKSAKLCTTLSNENGVKVSTVEHLLAHFVVSDNAIEIDNEEVKHGWFIKRIFEVLQDSEIKCK